MCISLRTNSDLTSMSSHYCAPGNPSVTQGFRGWESSGRLASSGLPVVLPYSPLLDSDVPHFSRRKPGVGSSVIGPSEPKWQRRVTKITSPRVTSVLPDDNCGEPRAAFRKFTSVDLRQDRREHSTSGKRKGLHQFAVSDGLPIRCRVRQDFREALDGLREPCWVPSATLSAPVPH